MNTLEGINFVTLGTSPYRRLPCLDFGALWYADSWPRTVCCPGDKNVDKARRNHATVGRCLAC